MVGFGIGLIELIIIAGVAIVLIIAIGAIILAALRTFGGARSQKPRAGTTEETRMIQELYNGLSKMEKRIESLETILMDRVKDQDRDNESVGS